jgi:hypothetical protein
MSDIPKDHLAVKKDALEMSAKEEELSCVTEALDKMLKDKGTLHYHCGI